MKLTQSIGIKHRILVIHGPNINLLGDRETSIYGKETFDSINQQIVQRGEELGFECHTFHSNVEGNIVTKIQKSMGVFDGIILNVGAYSHYSIAIRDALSAVKIPAVEVHMTNVYNREEFRHTSVLAGACVGQITGFGKHSYFLALSALAEMI